MAKELYDGIYSSHKLVFIERIERNLRFYLKDRILSIKKIGQELLFIIEKGDLEEVLGVLKENPEISIEILDSINQYRGKEGHCVLINLSSIANNCSLILKVLLGSGTYNDIKAGYKKVVSTASKFYRAAESCQKISVPDDEHYDARVINQSYDGFDCLDTYISLSDEAINHIYFDTAISRVLSKDFYRDLKLTDLLVYLSRFDYNAGIFPEICYCHAIEQLMQLKVSRRVQYIRMLMSELFRISSHLHFLSKINRILGHGLAFDHAMIEREKILRLLETITGARVNPNFIRIGGVKNDLDDESIYGIMSNLKVIFKKINKLEALMMDNPVITARLKNLCPTDRNTAIECAATGPNLRATGMRYDLRKNRNLLLYKDISFLVPSGKYGDCLDRVHIRFREIYQSIIIISQLVKALPDDRIRKILDLRDIDLPFCEMVSSIECPHGVFKIFLEAEGNRLLNLIVMGPSRNNLYFAEKVIPGSRLEDLELVLASFDISCGELLQ